MTTFSKLVIIGAGPHGLSLLTRLMNQYPESLYSDEQHERILHHCTNDQCIKRDWIRRNVIVVDSTSSQWLQRWNTQFETYDIQKLRSPRKSSEKISTDKRVFSAVNCLTLTMYGTFMISSPRTFLHIVVSCANKLPENISEHSLSFFNLIKNLNESQSTVVFA